MAATKTISFRCPDEMLGFIEQQAQKSGADKTTVIMKLLEAGRSVLGENVNAAMQPSDSVRQIVEEALAPLQAQVEELRQMIPVSTAPRDASEIPLEDLQLSVRSALVLERAQVKNISHLLLFNERYLLGMLGEAGAKEVKDALQRLGFTLPPGEQAA